MTAAAKDPDVINKVCSFHFKDGKDKSYEVGFCTAMKLYLRVNPELVEGHTCTGGSLMHHHICYMN
jgi:hypothetical protein